LPADLARDPSLREHVRRPRGREHLHEPDEGRDPGAVLRARRVRPRGSGVRVHDAERHLHLAQHASRSLAPGFRRLGFWPVPVGEDDRGAVEGNDTATRGRSMTKMARIVTMVAMALVVAAPAFAETGAAGGGIDRGLIGLAAGLGLGLAAFGAALGQGRATAAAMESVGRNPNSAD